MKNKNKEMHVLETLKLASILKKDQFNPIPSQLNPPNRNYVWKILALYCVRGYTFNWLIVTLKNVLV